MIPKFDVPFNGDMKLVDIIRQNSEFIEMVYGRAEDGYPQGRNTKTQRQITLEDISILINNLKDMNIKFNYVINGNNHGNKEFNKEYRTKFVNFVKDIKNMGADIVTIGNLFLLEVIVQEVPKIDIAASVILEPDNMARLKQITRAGAKYVTLSKVLLKNFNGLKNIISSKPEDVKLLLLANDPCLHNCAYTQYHNNILSHFSSEGGDYVNYCRLHCTQDFANDPRKVISASFIRPEDISTYGDIGFNLFKLCDRKQTTPWLERVINAYVSGSYEGNLSDILAPWSNIGGTYQPTKDLSLAELKEKGLEGVRDQTRFTPLINNRALDGYLDYWKNIKTTGCANEDCDKCNYCLSVAKKAYSPDSETVDKISSNIDIVLKAVKEANS